MLQTKMTEILGIKYPIQCGTMQGITTAELMQRIIDEAMEAKKRMDGLFK